MSCKFISKANDLRTFWVTRSTVGCLEPDKTSNSSDIPVSTRLLSVLPCSGGSICPCSSSLLQFQNYLDLVFSCHPEFLPGKCNQYSKNRAQIGSQNEHILLLQVVPFTFLSPPFQHNHCFSWSLSSLKFLATNRLLLLLSILISVFYRCYTLDHAVD